MNLAMINFNIASINQCTETEGPFKRLCIWFQGCNIHCKGCCNPDYQALESRHILSVDELIDIVKKAKSDFDIEGVTYSGGEPTLQQNLPILTARIKELGLGVISFTGHHYENVKELLCGCDVVLDGAYDENKPERLRRLLGSENQHIICLTDRYPDIATWFNKVNGIYAEINLNGHITINGDKV